jgi:hypothetical protein
MAAPGPPRLVGAGLHTGPAVGLVTGHQLVDPAAGHPMIGGYCRDRASFPQMRFNQEPTLSIEDPPPSVSPMS